MKILLFEDRPARRYELMGMLEDYGHEVYECGNIDRASVLFSNMHEELDLLIVDLAMSSDGLPNELKESSSRGYFSGWVWLNHCVLTPHPEFYSKVVIFSAFTDSFAEYVNENLSSDQMENFKRICIIAKNDEDWKVKLLSKLE